MLPWDVQEGSTITAHKLMANKVQQTLLLITIPYLNEVNQPRFGNCLRKKGLPASSEHPVSDHEKTGVILPAQKLAFVPESSSG